MMILILILASMCSIVYLHINRKRQDCVIEDFRQKLDIAAEALEKISYPGKDISFLDNIREGRIAEILWAREALAKINITSAELLDPNKTHEWTRILRDDAENS